MLWLLVPVLLAGGAGVVLLAVRSLESARRDLQRQVADLRDVRTTIDPVQEQIAATCATAVTRERR